MEYAHDEYCDIPFSLGICNSGAGIAPREYELRYPGQCHEGAVIFRQLGWLLRQIESVMPTAQVNAVRPQTVLTAAIEDTIIAVVNLESCDIAKNLEFPKRGYSKYFLTTNCIHTTTHTTTVLYGCNFSNIYIITPQLGCFA
jgi:hypothetical protein